MVSSALPSFVTVTTVPLSAAIKLAPEIPTSAATYFGLSSCRALSTNASTVSDDLSRVCLNANKSATSSWVL